MLHHMTSRDGKRSPIWSLYKRIDMQRSVCNLCDYIVKTTGGNTSGLWKHAERFHQKEMIEALNEKVHEEPTSEVSKVDLLAMAIATSGIPFRFVENKFFQKFLEESDVRLDINGVKIKKVLNKMAINGRVEASRILKNCQNLCLCFDGWTSKNFKFHTFAIFLLFFDENFERQTMFVSSPSLKGKATSENISKLIIETLDGVGVNLNQISWSVTDGGANVLKVCRDFRLRHVSCVCHELSLFFKDIFKCSQLTPVIEKSKKVAARLSKSATTRDRFLAMSNALGEMVEIPKSFSVTRWGGAYLQLKAYVKAFNVIRNTVDLAHLVPTSDELATAEKCIEMLEEAFSILTKLESDSSTASSIIPNVIALREHFKNIPNSSVGIGCIIKDAFNNRFDEILNNNTLSQLLFLDPRFSFFEGFQSDYEWDLIKTNFLARYAGIHQVTTPVMPKPSHLTAVAPIKESAIRKFMNVSCNDYGDQGLQKEISTFKNQIMLARPDENTDPLQFWKNHQNRFPILSTIARELLAIPSSSACTERLFSKSSQLVSNVKRNKIKPETVDTILQVSSRAILQKNSKIFNEIEDGLSDSEFGSSDDENNIDFFLLPLTRDEKQFPLQVAPVAKEIPIRSKSPPKKNKAIGIRSKRRRPVVDSDSE